MKSAILVMVLLLSSLSYAWDGVVSGVITSNDVTGAENFGFRVNIGSAAHCTGGGAWSYINASDSNYNTYVATLLLAKSTGASVTLYTNRVNGYCKIGYISAN